MEGKLILKTKIFFKDEAFRRELFKEETSPKKS
jgi:hypothetical protein